MPERLFMPEQFNPETLKQEEPVLKVIISRHGPKLSAEGEKNAKAAYFKDSVVKGFETMGISPEKEGLIHIASSDVERAVDTARIFNDKLQNTKHRQGKQIRTMEDLAVPFQPKEKAKEERFAEDLDLIANMQKELKPEIKKQIEEEFPEMDEEEKEAELRNRIDMIILTRMFEDKNNEIFQTSWEELADTFAKRYFGFAKHIKLLKEMKALGKQPADEAYIEIDVSHSFPITAFLKKYLIFDDGTQAKDMEAGGFFEKTGGVIRESNNFEMEYFENDQGEPIIKIKGEFQKGKQFAGDINLLKQQYEKRQ